MTAPKCARLVCGRCARRVQYLWRRWNRVLLCRGCAGAAGMKTAYPGRLPRMPGKLPEMVP